MEPEDTCPHCERPWSNPLRLERVREACHSDIVCMRIAYAKAKERALAAEHDRERYWKAFKESEEKLAKAEQEAAALRQERDEARRHLAQEVATVKEMGERNGKLYRILGVEFGANEYVYEAAERLTAALADRDQQLAAAKKEIASLKQDLKDARAVIENLWSTTTA